MKARRVHPSGAFIVHLMDPLTLVRSRVTIQPWLVATESTRRSPTMCFGCVLVPKGAARGISEVPAALRKMAPVDGRRQKFEREPQGNLRARKASALLAEHGSRSGRIRTTAFGQLRLRWRLRIQRLLCNLGSCQCCGACSSCPVCRHRLGMYFW